MAEVTASDPFTLVYRTLWDIVTGFAGIQALKANPRKLGFNNVIRWDQFAFPPGESDESFGAGESPVFSILQGRFDPDTAYHDGDTFRITQDYPIVIAGRDLNVEPVNILTWEVGRALFLADPYLGLNGLIVNPVKFTGGGFDPAGRSQWVKGDRKWVVMFTVRAEMLIPREAVVSGEFWEG